MPKKLFLVDGSNQAFRAHFAIQSDMRAPDGFPTRALFGFTNVLLKLLKDGRPDYMAVVFDQGKSFRNDLYPEYKGTRPDMPEDLRRQWPELAPLCRELGLTALAHEGWEADDIIGTLATRHASPELTVYIVSSDKDFCQLVNENVRIMDVQNARELGPPEVVERWGVPPEKIIDLLSLMGDSSDNVPGVPGVGEKTAVKLLTEHGDLESILARAAADPGGKGNKKIAENVDLARLSRKLVTIVTDMPVELGLEDLALRDPQNEALRTRMQRYNFRRLSAQFGPEAAPEPAVAPSGQAALFGARPKPAAPAPSEEVAAAPEAPPSSSRVDRSGYRAIQTADDLAWLVAQLRAAGRFAYDSETTSLDPLVAKHVGMSFCWDPGFAVYVPIAHTSGPNCPGAMEALLPLLADPTLKKTGQNLKYDLEVLRAVGADLRGLDGDTMLADYLLDVEQKHGLDEMARRLLGHEMITFKETAGPYGDRFQEVPIDKATQYAAEDAHVAFLLERELPLGPLERVYRELELPLVPVLADMELAGIGVDVAALEVLGVELDRRIQAFMADLHREAGEPFNVNSTQQLAQILFEKRGLKPLKKTKFGYSTDAATLEALAESGADPLPGMILAYRELAKLKSTYVDALPRCVAKDGRIHTSFHQAVAATGRLSSNEPNLQNIPVRTDEGRRIRACFTAKPGHVFLSADYSQIELRILAHFCGEGPLVEAYTAGEDIHRRTASEIFGVAQDAVTGEQRRAAKAINFGLIYGMSAFRLARELGIDRRQAQGYMDSYFARYPQVRVYMDGAIARARETGYAETRWGRRRTVRNLESSNQGERGFAERIAMNTPIQGTAADLIKLAMIRVHARLARDLPTCRLLLQVHDELILEVPDDLLEAARAAVVEEMQGVDQLAVPLVVETGQGRTWGEAH